MKLIKINTDHYIIVDETKIKMDDWYLDDTNTIRYAITEAASYWAHRKHYKKVTHSTQPLEDIEVDKYVPKMPIYDKIQQITLSEVKELIGEVDVEKKAEEEYPTYDGDLLGIANNQKRSRIDFIKGYNQAIEDNKDKKYTEEDVIRIVEKSRKTGLTAEYLLLSLQPKTEWEVEFIDGNLKLV